MACGCDRFGGAADSLRIARRLGHRLSGTRRWSPRRGRHAGTLHPDRLHRRRALDVPLSSSAVVVLQADQVRSPRHGDVFAHRCRQDHSGLLGRGCRRGDGRRRLRAGDDLRIGVHGDERALSRCRPTGAGGQAGDRQRRGQGAVGAGLRGGLAGECGESVHHRRDRTRRCRAGIRRAGIPGTVRRGRRCISRVVGRGGQSRRVAEHGPQIEPDAGGGRRAGQAAADHRADSRSASQGCGVRPGRSRSLSGRAHRRRPLRRIARRGRAVLGRRHLADHR